MIPPETTLPSGARGRLFRPRAASRVWFGLAIVAAFIALRVLVDLGRPRAIEADAILFGPLALAALLVLFVYLRNARLFFDHESVAMVDFWGRHRVWPRAAIARVDRFRTPGSYGARYAVFVGQDGRKLFSLSNPYWDLHAVVLVCSNLGIHLTGSFSELESPYRLNRRVPGMTTWRSWALGFGLVAVIVALVFVSTLLPGPSSGG